MASNYKRTGLIIGDETTSLSDRLQYDAKIKKQIEDRNAYYEAMAKYKQELADYETYQIELKAREDEQANLQNSKKNASVLTRIGGTLLDIPLSIFQGLMKGGEGIVDTVIGLTGFGNSDEAKANIQKNWTQETFGNNFDKLTKLSYLNDGTVGKWINGAMEGVGQMIPSIAASFIPYVGQAASLAYLGTSAMGTGLEEAYNEGANYGEGLAYGALSAGIELATEQISNVMPMAKKAFGKGILDKPLAKLTSSTAGKILVGMVGEGVEEVVSEFASPFTKYITYADELEMATGEELLDSFVIGALSAGILEGGNVVITRLGKGSYKVYSTLTELKELAQEENKIVNKNGQLTTEEINSFSERKADLLAKLEDLMNTYDEKKQNEIIKKNSGTLLEQFDVFAKKFKRFDENYKEINKTEDIHVDNQNQQDIVNNAPKTMENDVVNENIESVVSVENLVNKQNSNRFTPINKIEIPKIPDYNVGDDFMVLESSMPVRYKIQFAAKDYAIASNEKNELVLFNYRANEVIMKTNSFSEIRRKLEEISSINDINRSEIKINSNNSVDNLANKSYNDVEVKEYGEQEENEFRRIQEESSVIAKTKSWGERSKYNTPELRERLANTFRKRIHSFTSSNSNSILLSNTGSYNIHSNIEGKLFRDILEINKVYLENSEFVDLHDNYDNADCYLSDDGLSGFAIENGNLISLFKLPHQDNGSFIVAISDYIKSNATHCDCVIDLKAEKTLEEVYHDFFGFKTTSKLDFNYDILVNSHGKKYADNWVKKHGETPIAFMIKSDENFAMQHFNKDQYDKAQKYQLDLVEIESLSKEKLISEIKKFKYSENLEEWKYFKNLDLHELKLLCKYSKGYDLTFDEISSMNNVKSAEEYVNTHERLEATDNLELVKKVKEEFRYKLFNERFDKKSNNYVEPRKEHKSFFAIGLPGAGKSTSGLNDYIRKLGYIEFDNDIAKEVKCLEKYFDGGLGAGVIQEIASQAQLELWDELLKDGYNVAYPCIGKKYDKVCREVLRLKKYGYNITNQNDFSIGYVYVDLDTSMTRATTRFLSEGRYVSTNYITDVGLKPEDVYNKIMKEGIYDEQNNTSYKVAITKYDNRAENGKSSGDSRSQKLSESNNIQNKEGETRRKYGRDRRLSNETRDDGLRSLDESNDNLRDSQHLDTVIEATKGYFNPELQDMLKMEKLVYEVAKNSETVDKANEELKGTKLDTQVELMLKKINSGKKMTPVDVAKTAILIQKANNSGLYQQAVDLTTSLSMILTEYGQAVQAAKIIKNLSPSGKLMYFKKTQEELTKKNSKIKSRTADKRIIKKRYELYYNDDIVVTKENTIRELLLKHNVTTNVEEIVKSLKYLSINSVDKIKDILDKYNINKSDIIAKEYADSFAQNEAYLKNQYEKNEVYIPVKLVKELMNATTKESINDSCNKIQKVLDEQTKIGMFDKIQQWRYLSMLGNPKTHIRNIVSNIVMRQVYKVKNAIASGIENIMHVKPGERTASIKKTNYRMTQFANNLAIDAHSEVAEGLSKFNSYNANRTVFNNKVLEKLRKLNNDFLENVEDRSAFLKMYSYRFSSWATANNYSVEQLRGNDALIKKGQEIALQDALESTFKDYSALVVKINQIKSMNKISELVVSSIMPFTKTPINIARRGLEYSPVWLAKSIADIKKVKSGDISATTWINNMAKGMTGTMIAALGIFLVKSGFVSGSTDDDDSKKAKSYIKSTGKSPFSIKIGDKYYSLDWLAPASIPFFTGVAIFDATNKDYADIKITDYFDVMSGMLDPMTEMSFLSSLNDALSSFEGNKLVGVGQNMVKSFVSSFIPTIASQIAKSIDTTRRTTSTTKDNTYFVNSLKAKVPFLAETLEPYINVWGQEEIEANIFTRVMENVVYPFWIYENTESSVDTEIMRLYEKYGNSDIVPAIPKYYYTVDGEKHEMSSEEYTEYKKNYGQFSYNNLKSLFATNYYQNLSNEEKEAAIARVYEDARSYAKKDKVYLLSTALNNSNLISKHSSVINSITGDTRKSEVFAYINSQKLKKAQKYILYACAGYSVKSHANEIIDYIDTLNLTEEQRKYLFNICGIK